MHIHILVPLLTVLAYSSLARAWWCIGIKQEFNCVRNSPGGCSSTWYKAAARDGGGEVIDTGGTGIGLDTKSLCGTWFDGVGRLECHGDITANCAQNVATFGGYNCRTHCNGDDVCQRTPPGFIDGYIIASNLICA